MNRRDFFLGALSVALAVKAAQAQARHHRIGYSPLRRPMPTTPCGWAASSS